MKDTYYFSHDCNASQDPKLMMLLSECGLAGIGMYWTLIEILHQQPEGKITLDAYKAYIKFYSHYENGNLDNIEQMLIKCGTLVEQDNYVFSKRVQRNQEYRREISKKRSFAGKESGKKRSKKSLTYNNGEQVFNKCEHMMNNIK